jgi:hypothetical protein
MRCAGAGPGLSLQRCSTIECESCTIAINSSLVQQQLTCLAAFNSAKHCCTSCKAA